MKNFYAVYALLCILVITSCSKKDTPEIEEEVIFDSTFILTLENNKTTINFLNSGAFLTPNVYESTDGNSISFSSFDNALFVVSQKGPNYITQLDVENLNVDNVVTKSNLSSPSYLAMYSATDGLVIGVSGRGRRRKYNVAPVNITTGIGEKIDGFSNKILYNNVALLADGNKVLVADGKDLKAFNTTTKKVTTLLTFKENISGILKNKNGTIWVATEKRTEKAAFTKLNEDYTINEVVTITDDNINLFKNSLLSLNHSNFTAYWSESASGKIYRFNTITKLVEEFATPTTNNVAFTTVVKQHPVTKQVFVMGLKDFLDPDNSIIAIYNDNKSFEKEVKDVGKSPIDIYFSDKNFTN
ncbi:DUF5074 domain-containing protein [Polaribacter cellanae]|uniref:Uncharacterized protein n=1 Tax=Polaribacter cellanae TaxID=2818493 RepID=A0A975CPB7_9FLAO|nr:hypothetical protein [Polaribacter cellanae]QTE21387.1 hypothetical protein J3359_11170 [Polaribacter cellanae]